MKHRGDRDKGRALPGLGEGEVYARVTRLLGGNMVMATGTDGVQRKCRIAGRMMHRKAREWVHVGDLVLVAPRELHGPRGDAADLVFRFTDAEVRRLQRTGECIEVPRADGGEDDDLENWLVFDAHEQDVEVEDI